MIIKTYRMFSDPGHAWLRVPLSDVLDAGVANKVSSYSYLYNNYVYLEEDGDAPMFLKALTNQGVEFEIIETRGANNPSSIRRYPFYNTSVALNEVYQ